jgi:hypothetical protein
VGIGMRIEITLKTIYQEEKLLSINPVVALAFMYQTFIPI